MEKRNNNILLVALLSHPLINCPQEQPALAAGRAVRDSLKDAAQESQDGLQKIGEGFSELLEHGQEAAQNIKEIVTQKGGQLLEGASDKAQEVKEAATEIVEQAVVPLSGQARIEHAREEAQAAQQERESLATEITHLHELIRIATTEHHELEAQLRHAQEALNEIQRAHYLVEIEKPQEGIIDRVEETAIALKDMTVNAAGVLKNGITSGAQAAGHLVASTAVKAQALVQEARAKHLQDKLATVRTEREKAERELQHIHNRINGLKAEINFTHRKIEAATQSLKLSRKTISSHKA